MSRSVRCGAVWCGAVQEAAGRAHLRAKLSGQDEDRHEGHLAQHREDQGIAEHEQLIAEAQLLVDACGSHHNHGSARTRPGMKDS